MRLRIRPMYTSWRCLQDQKARKCMCAHEDQRTCRIHVYPPHLAHKNIHNTHRLRSFCCVESFLRRRQSQPEHNAHNKNRPLTDHREQRQSSIVPCPSDLDTQKHLEPATPLRRGLTINLDTRRKCLKYICCMHVFCSRT